MTVLVRSLATAAPKDGVEVRLIARDNEVRGGKNRLAGLIHFAPGLSRGEGGLAPGLVVASDGKADYNFVDLQQTPFDLTDRGSKAATRPRRSTPLSMPSAAFTVPARRSISPPCCATTPEFAASAPLTLRIKRPDGVEFKRVALADKGLGGRAFDLVLPADAASGGWTVQAFADPKSPALGETSFRSRITSRSAWTTL